MYTGIAKSADIRIDRVAIKPAVNRGYAIAKL